jgi:carboxypeptidase C (cathepsin A)
MVLKDEEGKKQASFFSISYVRDDVGDGRARPVIFSFNGGPGSSSVWLHLGAFGPRRVRLEHDGSAVPPPGRLTDNEHSLLDVADLVFIDPVSTGYSRSEDPKKAGEFHGFQEDIDSVAEFVRLYITREGRWGSPKFLAGESYGAIRGSGLAATLQDRYGMYLNGVVIVSGVWDFRTLIPHNSNDLPYMLFLPTMAAAAHYHGKVKGDLKELVSEAEEFALGDYALALHRGAALTEAEEKKVANQMAKLLGIDAGYVSDAGLRVSPWAFRKELLRESDRTIGRFDARMIGFDAGKLGEGPDYDASYNLIYGAYASGLKDYLRTELEFESDLPYEVLTGKVRPWNYDQFTNRYVSVADHVAGSLAKNKHLRYFLACGYYDLATPHLAIEYTLDHLEIPKHLRENFAFGYYAGGHMMYTNEKALAKLKKDLAKFITNR